MTLFNSNWLSNFIIDYSLTVLVRNKSLDKFLSIVTCESSGVILNQNRYLKLFQQKFVSSWKNKSKMLLPCRINGNHWILVYVDVSESSIYFFDPSLTEHERKKDMNYSKFFNNFIKFYKLVSKQKRN